MKDEMIEVTGVLSKNPFDLSNAGFVTIGINPNQPAIRKWAMENVVIDRVKFQEALRNDTSLSLSVKQFIKIDSIFRDTNPITLKSEVKDETP